MLLRLFLDPKHQLKSSLQSWHGNRISFSLHVHMHGDWCPLALVVSGELHEEAAHESQSKVCFAFKSGSYSKQHWSRMCDHSAQNLLALRSPQFSFALAVCGHKSVQMICVFLGYMYKRRVGDTISVKTSVWRLPGVPDMLHQPWYYM